MKRILLMLSAALMFCSLEAQARSRHFFDYVFTPPETRHQDYKTYMHDPMLQQNNQWDHEGWTPQSWLHDGQSAQGIVDNFFASGLLVERDVDCDNIPVLEVGESFLRLSPREQKRIAAFMDYAFGITQSSPAGMFYLTYRNKCQKVGAYTSAGLFMH